MSETPVEHAVYELMTSGACQSECDDLIAAVRAEERQSRQALVAALRAITEHPHQSYDHPTNGGNGMYGTGCADGHRCAANVARAVLAQEESR